MRSSILMDLEARASAEPDRLLLADGAVRLSYAEVQRRALAIGGYLRSVGVKKGERVAVLTSKAYEQPLAQLGVLAAEAVIVPISDLLRVAQVEHIVRDCGVRAAIVDHDKVKRLGPDVADFQLLLAGKGQSTAQPSIESITGAGFSEFAPHVIGSDNAAIIYSSGSTGLPKGILLTHRNLWDGARIVSQYLGLQADDRLAQIMSFNFDYGMNQLFSAIHVGAELHLHSFQFPKDVFEFLRANEITTLALMPIFLNRLFDLRFYKPSFAHGIHALRRITTSGGRVPLPTLQAMRSAFPETDIYLMFGLTEAFRSTFLDPDQVDIRPESIGKAIPDVEIMVLDEQGEECPPDQPGELVHRGGVIASGYWNAPEKTAQRFRPWTDASGNTETVVYSGDLVRRDAEGYLYFIGRRDNMIKTSGHRVSPEEIEQVAETLPGVGAAIVFSRPHDVLGEEIIMVCTPNESGAIDEIELRAAMRERLAAYMVPPVIIVADRLSVTPGNEGKLDRAHARRIAEERLSAP